MGRAGSSSRAVGRHVAFPFGWNVDRFLHIYLPAFSSLPLGLPRCIITPFSGRPHHTLLPLVSPTSLFLTFLHAVRRCIPVSSPEFTLISHSSVRDLLVSLTVRWNGDRRVYLDAAFCNSHCVLASRSFLTRDSRSHLATLPRSAVTVVCCVSPIHTVFGQDKRVQTHRLSSAAAA